MRISFSAFLKVWSSGSPEETRNIELKNKCLEKIRERKKGGTQVSERDREKSEKVKERLRMRGERKKSE